MGESRQQRFTLGDWLVDPVIGLICSGNKEVTIRPREMDLLVYLAKRTDTVVATDNLIENVWKGVFVTNDSVYFSGSCARHWGMTATTLHT